MKPKKKYVTYICLNVCIYQYFMYIFHPVLPLSTTPQPPKRSNFTAPNSHVDGDIWHDKYQENAPKSKINQFCLNDLSSTEMNWILMALWHVCRPFSWYFASNRTEIFRMEKKQKQQLLQICIKSDKTTDMNVVVVVFLCLHDWFPIHICFFFSPFSCCFYSFVFVLENLQNPTTTTHLLGGKVRKQEQTLKTEDVRDKIKDYIVKILFKQKKPTTL